MVKRILMISVLATLLWGVANAQIYRVAQMNTEQIRALDKQKTVVILPGGVLEEHGPHLPSFTDGYSNEWLTERLAEAIVERPGWAVLVFPIIPLGHAGGNEIGGKYVFPGTYSLRRTTLRAVFMDLATELGEQGFRRIFVMHGHGSPFHNQMLDQAGDYFRDTYGGRMVNLHGLEPNPEQLSKLKLTRSYPRPSAAEVKENGSLDVHAGLEETSRLMFLRPELVNPIYRTLPPFSVNTLPELFQTARAPNWLGYIGSPRLATANFGAQLQQYLAGWNNALAIAILDGLDEREIPRYADFMLNDKAVVRALEGSTKYEVAIERKQREWMKKKGIE
ncbi:MAG TPA: creatininase family protein [Pyrinomonadaceae bacterium]|nr:creatininase family protein [Pyrinomonadaceae bacterium]